ncbi:hypothetical protein COW99_01580 [Candidatus Roizmanbacteria bacterium CG22_combo_CG10-13_8_21_14_all_38_20]|uniref:UDP-N-acetylmuramoyl-L-alanyl-D-glutamate--2, 6-diaminopimelate ligase n=1 Tax=Candidatus Roizmanbacteria bacterium CG22_combo_CG10-13_8_21_14_all_38_20 TaxID=1974862 RepID=A0A2H0BW35_9BACT|nr:UDP-N-acetylmuramyl-tripeptide synthetase [Candidatus Microgenomates bacterium]PIP61896.1 MAG: hypothetical protein COW99_01580 [Candidatus Roizmanbacteria bacterium CG22_combo_CG10-13_8_21_14_all_38_20]PJC32129.1 MAG: hypothetical protein CO050_01375 [Candidatus Roizmanbacteria bacterium CG_4_9_14_0_2_um_filter_38_17]
MALVTKLRGLIPNNLVNTFWHYPIALFAALRYGFPAKKLTLIGVTGTDGKTTTTYIINHLLKKAGYKTAMITSVLAEIAGKTSNTGFHVTSPHPWQVQKYLAEAVKSGVTHAILEVTSHALDQHRFAGCSFRYGIVTNIKPDHLDYHKTYDNYFHSKSKLLLGAQKAVLNKDDQSFNRLNTLLTGKDIVTYSIKEQADFTGKKIIQTSIPVTLPGDYNLSNILAATAVVNNIGLSIDEVSKYLPSFKAVPGRFNEVDIKKDFRVVIDFAHTPYGLQALLTALRNQTQARIIAVFGCAAERGADRREMGRVGGKLADITIITAEDPRFEGVEKISAVIAGWADKAGAEELSSKQLGDSSKKDKHVYTKIADRQGAINAAIDIAKPGDIIVLCGKGHEQSMNFRGVEYPWDENKAVQKALTKRYGSK